MELTTVFLGVFALTFFGLLWWHSRWRGIASKLHAHQMGKLQYALQTNQQQINKRDGALSQYQFLKYNLSAALLEQPEIRL